MVLNFTCESLKGFQNIFLAIRTKYTIFTMAECGIVVMVIFKYIIGIIIMHLYSSSLQYPAQQRLCDYDKLNIDVLESGAQYQLEYATNTILLN